MAGKWKLGVVCLTLALTAAMAWRLTAGGASIEKQRETLAKNHKDGNYKDAYEGLRKLALDPKEDPMKVSWDLDTGIDCLRKLGRVAEVDSFREAVIEVHQKNWRLLQTAAKSYVSPMVEHWGYIVAGKFYRGQRKARRTTSTSCRAIGFEPCNSCSKALEQTKVEAKENPAVAQFCLDFANMLLNGGGQHEPWRLQYLTDLTKLPDYDEGYYYHTRRRRPGR